MGEALREGQQGKEEDRKGKHKMQIPRGRLLTRLVMEMKELERSGCSGK